MGLQCAGSFGEWLGVVSLLPESEQRQTPVTPTDVEVTLPALTPGLENPCKNTPRGHGI